eukprot:437809_1
MMQINCETEIIDVSYAHALIYLNAFCWSIKYWNNYQVAYFVKHYFNWLTDESVRWAEHMVNRSISIPPIPIMILVKVALQAKKTHIFDIINISPVLIKRMNLVWKIYKSTRDLDCEAELKQKPICGFIRCKNSQNSNQKFKLCSGCKMTYYCSKSCQKRSWNIRHRTECNILHNYSI